MFKLCVFLAVLAIAFAAPSPAPAPAPGAIVAPLAAYAALPYSSSSQSFVRNHNTYAAAPLAYAPAAAYTYAAPAAYAYAAPAPAAYYF